MTLDRSQNGLCGPRRFACFKTCRRRLFNSTSSVSVMAPDPIPMFLSLLFILRLSAPSLTKPQAPISPTRPAQNKLFAGVLDRMPRFAQSQNANAQHHAGGSSCRGFGGALEYRCPKPGLRGKNRAPEQKPVMGNLFRNHFLRAHAQFDAETGPRNKTRARGTPAARAKPGTGIKTGGEELRTTCEEQGRGTPDQKYEDLYGSYCGYHSKLT